MMYDVAILGAGIAGMATALRLQARGLHKDYGDTPLTQTHTLRGRLIPALFLELTYHLEHHLYPQVPSHHLAELAHRLDPYFAQAGVKVWHVI